MGKSAQCKIGTKNKKNVFLHRKSITLYCWKYAKDGIFEVFIQANLSS